MKLETCRVAVGPAEEAVKAAKTALKAAQAAVVDAERDAEAAEKAARKVECDRASKASGLEAMLRRLDGVADPAPAAVTT